MKKLSIIVPVYNVEKYVEQCIRSLYDQDIPMEEYEVICVDDCTPDGSCAIIERLQQEFPTLRLLHNERNKKLGGARNTGIRAAEGKYIMFVDSDDKLIPNCLGRLVDEIKTSNCQYVHFNLRRFDDNGLKDAPAFAFPSSLMKGADLFFCGTIPWQHQISACRKIYRTDFLRGKNLYFEEDIMYEDNDFSMRVAAVAERCKHIEYCPYLYRFNPESVTGAKVSVSRVRYWQMTWPIMLRLLDKLGKQDKRFDTLIRDYLKYDLEDVYNNMMRLTKDERQQVKKAMSIAEWYRVIRLLPLKRRLIYIKQLIKA